MSVKSWHILEADECWALLEARHLGRLAFVDQDGPIVLPINYAVVRRCGHIQNRRRQQARRGGAG